MRESAKSDSNPSGWTNTLPHFLRRKRFYLFKAPYANICFVQVQIFYSESNNLREYRSLISTSMLNKLISKLKESA